MLCCSSPSCISNNSGSPNVDGLNSFYYFFDKILANLSEKWQMHHAIYSWICYSVRVNTAYQTLFQRHFFKP